jgi:chromate reductase, NAD(P)H dehydrogenase (quinone)
MIKILAFAGSARKNSYNQKLVKIAAFGASECEAEVTIVDLAHFEMPIYNADLEATQGMPEKARIFKQLLIEHNGLLIASPEYNSAFSPLLKNVIDWASRAESTEEQPLLAFKGKVAAIMATSPSALGGLRGLVFLRMLLANIGVMVLPTQKTIAHSAQAFSEDGSLIDINDQQAVMGLGRELVSNIACLRS